MTTTANAPTLIVFPGQGSQIPGMAAAFMEHPATRELFEAADDALGFHLTRLMRSGPAEDLTRTENAQAALLLAGIAALTYLENQSDKNLPQLAGAVAGHSLGEYTAVTAAGGLPLALALQLVRLRGQAMSRAVPPGAGGMSAVLGLEVEPLTAVATPLGVAVANDNAPGQLILSGPADALVLAEAAAKQAGAKRVLRLPVSGPFHTTAMQPAATEVQDFLISQPLHPLTVPVWANATAALSQDAATAARNLIAQITGQVRWREIMRNAAENGTAQVVELGVGKVLSGLAARCDARLQAVSLSSPQEIDAWLAAPAP